MSRSAPSPSRDRFRVLFSKRWQVAASTRRLFYLNSQSPHRPCSLWLDSSTLPSFSPRLLQFTGSSLDPPSPTHVLYAVRRVVLDWLLSCFVSFCLLFMVLSIELRSSHMLSMSCMSSPSFLNSTFSSLKTTFRVRPKFLFDLQALSLPGSSLTFLIPHILATLGFLYSPSIFTVLSQILLPFA